ncbi:MAG: S41 family peptidase [Candidatus Brocadia sp. AMX2]|uniref:Carboxyl-terminal processing protease n=1 Tax=Candidatus Brocadia sinica JPN1 TaxID=1197129 RepID=A0ABQ0K2L1_9BACT|nr:MULTISPECIES: S41 family peptidase [Brocadia]KXK33313.1 MAG: protease [Candidatus Brocadia sinica]MBC6931594.1 S41 family peptidase [Candidatus Brocadia sp.]MBL1169235.1 S41 family peptidase [Candidatus Brocadia sp. AMX1]NOG42966.1 S41 family peptidase [Planctomycetota bacterium]KAA0242459.1 MAG: S41 family peptidase [Candidatus Brocadia sp. AMX2]
MKKRLSIFLLFITLTALRAVSFGQDKPSEEPQVEAKEQAKPTSESIYEEFEELIKVVKELQDKYVDEIQLNTILINAYRGMLSGLDPYSQYFSPEELEDLKIETEGEFEGLGIEVIIKDGLLIVITPLLDSPAFKAGILVGDRIIKIDGESTENMSIREAIKKLRGKLGTKITLTVVHEGDTAPVDITIERAKIYVNSIRGARIADDAYKIGYLAVSNFQENTAKDMDTAIQYLLKKGMKSLILDLRFNPGGLLNAAVDMADKFLEKGIIVSTRGRDKTQNYIYHARKKGTYPNFPMVVLVNNGSASASEIVAGALKDHKRGLLLGVKTFGKGSVQSLIPVGDGKAALKLTTARYYTPSGVCIHEKGIEPDITVPLTFAEIKALHEHLATLNIESKMNEVREKDAAPKGPVEEKGKPKYEDSQLERAIDILKGIEVYAKGIHTH